VPDAAACEAKALASDGCVAPKTVAFEGGHAHNCFCANATCAEEQSSWLDLYVQATGVQAAAAGAVAAVDPSMEPTSTGIIYSRTSRSEASKGLPVGE
jgi:hypothetical protein